MKSDDANFDALDNAVYLGGDHNTTQKPHDAKIMILCSECETLIELNTPCYVCIAQHSK